MDPAKNNFGRYLLGCVGMVIGFFVIYFGFEEVSIPEVTKGYERPAVYVGLAILVAGAVFCLTGRKR